MLELKEKYAFKEDGLSYLTKLLQTYFSSEKDLASHLQEDLDKNRYLIFKKKLEESPFFKTFIDPFRIKSISSSSNSFNFYENKKNEEKIVFSKTFPLCKEYNEFYKSESFQLKQLYIFRLIK